MYIGLIKACSRMLSARPPLLLIWISAYCRDYNTREFSFQSSPTARKKGFIFFSPLCFRPCCFLPAGRGSCFAGFPFATAPRRRGCIRAESVSWTCRHELYFIYLTKSNPPTPPFFIFLFKQFTAWVDAVIFVFSLESEASFNAIYSYHAKMAQYRNAAEIPFILVGTQGSLHSLVNVVKKKSDNGADFSRVIIFTPQT